MCERPLSSFRTPPQSRSNERFLRFFERARKRGWEGKIHESPSLTRESKGPRGSPSENLPAQSCLEYAPLQSYDSGGSSDISRRESEDKIRAFTVSAINLSPSIFIFVLPRHTRRFNFRLYHSDFANHIFRAVTRIAPYASTRTKRIRFARARICYRVVINTRHRRGVPAVRGRRHSALRRWFSHRHKSEHRNPPPSGEGSGRSRRIFINNPERASRTETFSRAALDGETPPPTPLPSL